MAKFLFLLIPTFLLVGKIAFCEIIKTDKTEPEMTLTDMESKIVREITTLHEAFRIGLQNVQEELKEALAGIESMKRNQVEMKSTVKGLELAIDKMKKNNCYNDSGYPQKSFVPSSYDAIPAPRQANPKPECNLDIMFVLDGSGSVGEKNFNKAKNWVKNFTREIKIVQKNVSIGVIQYSHKFSRRKIHDQPYIKTHIELGEHNDYESFANEVDEIELQGFTTYTGAALKKALLEFENSTNFNKTNARQAMILITDGPSRDWRAVKINSMKLRAIEVVSFAIGIQGAYQPDLQMVATGNANDSTRVFKLSDFDKLDAITENLQNELQLVIQECQESQEETNDEEIKAVVKPILAPGTLMEAQAQSEYGVDQTGPSLALHSVKEDSTEQQKTGVYLPNGTTKTTQISPRTTIGTNSDILRMPLTSSPSTIRPDLGTTVSASHHLVNDDFKVEKEDCSRLDGFVYEETCFWVIQHSSMTFNEAKKKCSAEGRSQLADVYSKDHFDATVRYLEFKADETSSEFVAAWTSMTRDAKGNVIHLSNKQPAPFTGLIPFMPTFRDDDVTKTNVYLLVWREAEPPMIRNGFNFASPEMKLKSAICQSSK